MQGIGRPEKSYNPPTSDELIETFSRTGRPEDFEQIVRRYAALVLCNCRRVTGNAHDAEDASQLVFLALAMEIKSGKSIHRLGPWLQRVANRQSLKLVRSRGRRQRRENAARKTEMHLVDVDAPMDASITAGVVRDAIDELPERYRLPVILHYFGGMSLDAVAAELKLKRQAVGTRLFRGRKMLGVRLAARGVRLDEHTLGAALAFFVPAAVIASVLRSASEVSVPSAAATSMLPASSFFRAISVAIMQRPLRLAAVAMVLLFGGSGMAWVAGVKSIDLRKLHFDPVGWLGRVLQLRVPTLISDESSPVTQNQSERIVQDLLPPTQRVETIIKALPPPVISSPQPMEPVVSAARPPSPAPRVDPPPPPQAFTLTVPPRVPIFDKPLPQLPVAARHAETSARADAPMSEESSQPLDVGVDTDQTLALDASELHVSQLRLGVMASGGGTFLQGGGSVVADRVVIGDKGRGLYDLQHGRLEAGEIIIGAGPQSHGEFDVGGGEVVMTSSGDFTVGLRGSGKLVVGTQFAPGEVRAAYAFTSSQLIVRATDEAHGIVIGWGSLGTGGLLINNGQVIADGFDHDRSLNLSSFTNVVNEIDNPQGGTNGWYVQRGGRIVLPTFAIKPGTHTYTWGESDQDATLDLVNSMRLEVRGQPTDARLTISLRTVAAADPLDVSLPAQMSIFGLWEFDAQSFDPKMIDVLVRYNDRAVNAYASAEDSLQMLAYDGQWRIAAGLWRDGTSKWIGGDFDGTFKYLAVGVPWTLNVVPPASALYDSGVVPEPSCAWVLLASGLLLMRRRRSPARVDV